MIFDELNPRPRLLLGPGPSPVHPRVLKAMSSPVVGHLDPDFLQVMDECQSMLRDLFQTRNQVTFTLSGTGSAGMDASVGNMIEEGDKAIVCVAGFFGERLADVAGRFGAEVNPHIALDGQTPGSRFLNSWFPSAAFQSMRFPACPQESRRVPARLNWIW